MNNSVQNVSLIIPLVFVQISLIDMNFNFYHFFRELKFLTQEYYYL